MSFCQHLLSWVVGLAALLSALPTSHITGAEGKPKHDLTRELIEAVNVGDVDRVESLLNEGADVNGGDSYNTPLNQAAYKGDLNMVKLLVEKGADLEGPESTPGELRWRSPLVAAADKERIDVVKYLLERGALVDGRKSSGNTALFTLSGTFNLTRALPIIKLLIEKGADVMFRNRYGLTPLHEAAKRNFTALAKLLLEKGADLKARDNLGMTPLFIAVAFNRYDMAKFLIKADKGAQLDTPGQFYGSDPSVAMDDVVPPLTAAVMSRKMKMVKLLIKEGANVNAKSKLGHTPLYYCQGADAVSFANLLKENGAKPLKKLSLLQRINQLLG